MQITDLLDIDFIKATVKKGTKPYFKTCSSAEPFKKRKNTVGVRIRRNMFYSVRIY